MVEVICAAAGLPVTQPRQQHQPEPVISGEEKG